MLLYRCLIDALDLAKQNKDLLGINLVISKCEPQTQKSLIEKAKAIKAELLQK
jgi:hypothetical protein